MSDPRHNREMMQGFCGACATPAPLDGSLLCTGCQAPLLEVGVRPVAPRSGGVMLGWPLAFFAFGLAYLGSAQGWSPVAWQSRPIALFGVAAAIVGSVIAGLIRVSRPRASQPSCGRCGYPTTGMSTHVCPECGSDVFVSGVLSRSVRAHPMHSRRCRVTRTIGVVVAGLGLATLTFINFPIPHVRTRAIVEELTRTTVSPTGGPVISMYALAYLEDVEETMGWMTPNGSVAYIPGDPRWKGVAIELSAELPNNQPPTIATLSLVRTDTGYAPSAGGADVTVEALQGLLSNSVWPHRSDLAREAAEGVMAHLNSINRGEQPWGAANRISLPVSGWRIIALGLCAFWIFVMLRVYRIWTRPIARPAPPLDVPNT